MSDCLCSQAMFGCHGRLSRKIALRMVRSFRATAMRATSLGLPAATSLSRKSFEGWVVTAGDHGSDEQGVADAFSSAADEALAAPLAGLTGPRRNTDQGRNAAAIERTEFRQFGDQSAGDDRADTGNGGQQIFLLGPDRRAAHMIVDLTVEFGQLLFHRLAQPGDALLAGACRSGAARADLRRPSSRRSDVGAQPDQPKAASVVRQRTRLALVASTK